MQQVWSVPGVIEKYLSEEESLVMRRFFAGQYSLNVNDHPEEVIAMVLRNPEKFVMKPQREGGGNLHFGEQMVHELTTLSPEERSSYIIMDLIEPPVTRTYFHVFNDKSQLEMNEFLELCPGLSELGTFEFYLENKNTKEVYINKSEGMLIRTKHSNDKEGGVCVGRGFLSSVYIV